MKQMAGGAAALDLFGMDDSQGQSVVKLSGPAAEEDPDRHCAPTPGNEAAHGGDDNEKAPRRTTRRVASLDVFRGLTVAVSSVCKLCLKLS